MSHSAVQVSSNLTRRRRQRLERELRALHAMEGHLHFWDIVCAVFAIPALALVCFAIAYKLHWVSASVLVAAAGALACGAFIWWIGRRSLALAVLIVYALLLIAFEATPEWFDFTGSTDRKARRRAKLAQAISKREALLKALDEAKP